MILGFRFCLNVHSLVRTTMETETSSVHQRLLLTCAGGISATLLSLVALAEVLASSQFIDLNKMYAIDASNEKRKPKSRRCQTTKPIDGEENENENNDSDNELGEDQEVLENGEEEGKNAPTKDGANGGEDASNDNGDGGSENSGEGGDDDEEDNDDGGSDKNNEDNNEDEEDVDEEDAEEDNFEEEDDDDEETLPPPKKRKK